MTQKLGDGFEFNKKACFVCGSLNHLIKDCNFYENKMVEKFVLNNKGRVTGQREVRPVWNNAQRVNHQNKLTHPHPKRNFVPTAVLTRSGNVPVNTAKQSSSRAAISNSTARYVNTAASRPTVNGAKPSSNVFHKSHSSVKRTIYQRTAPKNSDFKEKVNTAKVKYITTAGTKAVVSVVQGHEENAVKSSACWIWRPTGKVIDHISKDSGSYMPKRFDYGNLQHALQILRDILDNGCSRAYDWKQVATFMIIKILDGEFVCHLLEVLNEVKLLEKKNNVLFTETECLILSPDFKLLDKSKVLLKVPRQNNMYSFNLKNVVPSGGLTCLFAKAIIDESNLWHRRLGHVNFKTMNKLVRGNLVRGTKLVSSISQPLQMLHMDLFGLTFVKSLNKKMYCLVVTDDFSRFSWVFFLASKDETSGILKTFITGIENQINHKVKIIRCDNGTEFKNSEMNQFYEMKGIKREFSVARTPQQNRVAERKNRTLIEAARTMLADSLLPTTFWAEAINTACYVQNRVLITKPHNKTPYELLIGRPPNLDFMRPFGCPVTILNTLDHLGKFEGKADEGFLVGYSVNSKAFRVFNTRTRKVEENLHIKFLENKPYIEEVSNVNGSANMEQGKAYYHEIYLLPFLASDSQGLKSSDDEFIDDAAKKNEVQYPANWLHYDDEDVGAEADLNNLETTMNVSHIPIIRIHKYHPKDQIIRDINSAIQTRRMINFSKENAMVSYISKQRRTNHKDYQNCLFACFLSQIEPKKVIQALTYLSWIEAMQEELLQFKLQKMKRGNCSQKKQGQEYVAQVYPEEGIDLMEMDVKSAFLYGTIDEEVEKALYGLHQALRAWYETLSTYLIENGFRRGTIDKTLFIKKDKCDILLVQVYVDDIIFRSTKMSLCDEFEKKYGIFISQDKYVVEILKKFDFATVKTAITPMEHNKAMIKDEEANSVDVHLYRSMIGSLMYLTTSRPDIMFTVCACARFQVTPKVSYLHAVKRIFRYLKGQPKLGLWYPRDSPFNLEAFSDSDYARASLDRKSTTGGCQFLGKRLISRQW
ncbi:putative ribonuclease H-like domain-containing protein [Tanacetum coccineum]